MILSHDKISHRLNQRTKKARLNMFITLTELRYITAVAKEKHFGRAAKKCFVSQPTLSIAIKKLEINLGLAIFERDKTHVTLTTHGEIIIKKANVILDMAHEIETFAKNTDPFTEPLKIGAIHTIGPYLYPSLMNLINQELPQLHLHIEEDFTKNLEEKLLNTELDAIIVAKPFVRPGIDTIELYSENLVVITPHDHHFKNKKSILPNALINETLLLLGKGHCFRDQVLEICPSCNLNTASSNHTIVTSSIETIKQMVAYNQGISIVPQSTITNSKSALFNTYNFAKSSPKREVILAYRSSSSKKEVFYKLSQLIQEVSKKLI